MYFIIIIIVVQIYNSLLNIVGPCVIFELTNCFMQCFKKNPISHR